MKSPTIHDIRQYIEDNPSVVEGLKIRHKTQNRGGYTRHITIIHLPKARCQFSQEQQIDDGGRPMVGWVETKMITKKGGWTKGYRQSFGIASSYPELTAEDLVGRAVRYVRNRNATAPDPIERYYSLDK